MPSFYTIKEAIRAGKRLKVRLSDGERIVEPHVLGRSRNGRTLMRAYQVHGPKERNGPWKLLDVARIEAAVETGAALPTRGGRPTAPTTLV